MKRQLFLIEMNLLNLDVLKVEDVKMFGQSKNQLQVEL